MRVTSHIRRALLIAGIGVAAFAVVPGSAKEAAASASHRVQRSFTMTAGDVAAFERRLTPYFSYLVEHRSTPPSGTCYVPDQIDRDLILRYARSFSAGFVALYRQAINIPTDFVFYTSPGGHFEIYYTTTDAQNSVPVADRYGFSGANWRTKTTGGNGVPDYIDEVAWACDSAWSMEVDRFGFPGPPGYKDGVHNSSLYKVVVTYLGDAQVGLYGVTDPDINPVGAKGYASVVSVRNEWSGWGIYEQRPYDAVRITIAHEFFHGVQYGMTWDVNNNVFLDNFTVGWTEGSAVLMEGLGFDTIKDYLQYTSAYFTDPTSPMLSNNMDGVEPYKNSLLTKFMYENIEPLPDIGYVKAIFMRNYAAPTGFLTNLQETSSDYNTTWPRVLGAFHSQSLFTGSNADPRFFIKDASLLPTLTFSSDTGLSNTKFVKPFGCETFTVDRAQYQGDTLTTFFAARSPFDDNQWAVNIVLHGATAAIADTIESLRVDRGIGSDTIPGWQRYREAVVVVSNAHDLISAEGRVTVSFNLPPPPVVSGDFWVYPNPLHLSGASDSMKFTGVLITSLRIFTSTGTLVFSQTSQEPAPSMVWKPLARSTSKVTPGTYVALIGYRSEGTGTVAYRQTKIMILPKRGS